MFTFGNSKSVSVQLLLDSLNFFVMTYQEDDEKNLK